MTTHDKQYDFIIVGAGAAGCMLAWRLAHTAAKPSVLLLEAGGRNDNIQTRIDGERFAILAMYPEQNWSYKSTPQPTLYDRVITYDRGKGLGGSTAINFCAWTVAGKDDHDKLAELCDDAEWSWSRAQQRYRRIENYQSVFEGPGSHKKYLNAQAQDHGTRGPIKVGFPAILEPSFVYEMDALVDQGSQLNQDINSGDQLGIGACPNTAYGGHRTTAADALKDSPNNLNVLTDSPIAKVLSEGKTAVGVELISGTKYNAGKEVILSCGAIDSPKVLMHSGIGPADQLEQHGVAVLHANDHIGANLQDHTLCFMTLPRRRHTNVRAAYYADALKQSSAREQWLKDGTGPLAEMACQFVIGFLKHDAIIRDPETAALPHETQKFLAAPTTPHFELVANSPDRLDMEGGDKAPPCSSYSVILMNPQSRGRLSLASADPSRQLDIDLRFLEHLWDRMMATRATREILRLGNREPDGAKEGGLYNMPASDSDEDILAWLKQGVVSCWHATGTVAVGTCLDRSFKVKGVDGLRVADMSSVPLLPNAHTQSMAYLVGLMAGDKLVEEYGLDQGSTAT